MPEIVEVGFWRQRFFSTVQMNSRRTFVHGRFGVQSLDLTVNAPWHHDKLPCCIELVKEVVGQTLSNRNNSIAMFHRVQIFCHVWWIRAYIYMDGVYIPGYIQGPLVRTNEPRLCINLKQTLSSFRVQISCLQSAFVKYPEHNGGVWCRCAYQYLSLKVISGYVFDSHVVASVVSSSCEPDPKARNIQNNTLAALKRWVAEERVAVFSTFDMMCIPEIKSSWWWTISRLMSTIFLRQDCLTHAHNTHIMQKKRHRRTDLPDVKGPRMGNHTALSPTCSCMLHLDVTTLWWLDADIEWMSRIFLLF